MDLTIHSTFTPGSKANIDKILKTAQRTGLQCISITDKNTAIFHMATKIEANKKLFSGRILVGAEFEANYNNQVISFLCYNFDAMNVQQWAHETYEKSELRQNKMFTALKNICKNMGVIIDENMVWNPKMEFAYQYFLRNIKLNPQNRQFFYGNRFPKTNAEFYEMVTKDETSPFYVNRALLLPTPDDVINTIHKNHGVVFLANPFSLNKLPHEVLALIKQKHIDGVEVYSPEHTHAQEVILENFCFKNGLMKTGGSRFDATKYYNKMIDLKGKLFIG